MEESNVLSEDELKAWKRKRKVTVMIFSFQSFLLEINSTVIVPTLWFYLLQLNTPNPKLIYGLITGSQNIMAFMSCLVVSRLADRTRSIKIVIVCINSLIIIGNLCYTIGVSPYLLLFGQWLAGSGRSMNPVMLGEICRSYEPNQLTRITAIWTVGNALGAITGSAMNMVLWNINFSVGGLRITYVNAGTFFVCCSFIIAQCLVWFFGSDLSKEYDLKEVLRLQTRDLDKNEKHCTINEGFDEDIKSQSTGRGIEIRNTKHVSTTLSKSKWVNIFKVYVKSPTMLTIFLTTFIFGFSIMSYEVLATLTAAKILNLNAAEIGLAFTCSGILYLVICLVVCKINDISVMSMLFGGFLVTGTANICLITIGVDHKSYYVTVVCCTSVLICYTLLWVVERIALRVLTSNLVTSTNQSFVEALRYNLTLIGLVLGALLSSISMDHLEVIGIILLMAIIIDFALFWKKRNTLYNPEPIEHVIDN